MQCLNNCSYPNGVCNSTSGFCNCRMMYSPYNNTREFEAWGGEDCSYILPYAAASRAYDVGIALVVAWLSICVFLFADVGFDDDEHLYSS